MPANDPDPKIIVNKYAAKLLKSSACGWTVISSYQKVRVQQYRQPTVCETLARTRSKKFSSSSSGSGVPYAV